MNYEFRRNKIEKKLKREGLDLFFTRHYPNVRYLCPSFKGEGTILITKDRTFLLVDSRYTQQAKLEIGEEQNIEIAEMKKPFMKSLLKLFSQTGVKSVAFETEYTTFAFLEMLKKHCKGVHPVRNRSPLGDRTEMPKALPISNGVQLHPVKDWVENLRVIKDDKEISHIRRACSIVDKILGEIIDDIKWGKTSELELENEIEYRFKKEGSEHLPFKPIIVGGSRASFPHAHPTNETLNEKEFVIVDCGASYEGYGCDLTRTIGKNIMDTEKIGTYNLVLKAQEAAINNIKPGVKTSDLCKLVREMFWKEDVVQFFIHGLGHGVGLDIHEAPALSSHGSVKLKEGMVITIEPGIYIPNKYGVRIEDTVLVTSKGCEVLTRLPKSSWQLSS
ncbi:MAG: Xaa-Pro peptidase family protein [Candidatus Ratteibacteria bacterium]|nr:Xaa-Pro peptidase family protein [Candidatus Ratteibacteria bacterium]